MARTPVLQEPLAAIVNTVPATPIVGETDPDETVQVGKGGGVKVEDGPPLT